MILKIYKNKRIALHMIGQKKEVPMRTYTVYVPQIRTLKGFLVNLAIVYFYSVLIFSQ